MWPALARALAVRRPKPIDAPDDDNFLGHLDSGDGDYVTFDPGFKRVWLEMKKRLLGCRQHGDIPIGSSENSLAARLLRFFGMADRARPYLSTLVALVRAAR